MAHVIYEVINIQTDKKYIGQTESPETRKEQHFSNSHNSSLKKDIEKLGKDNFEFEVIDETDDPISINFMEINAIEEAAKKCIYNLSPGGQLISNFDRFVCGSCDQIKELKHIVPVNDKKNNDIGIMVFNNDISEIVLLCHGCRIYEGESHPVLRDRKKYPLSHNLTANALMDLVLNYDVPDRVINKLMIVGGKMNTRMAYAYFTKRLGYK